jgi:hypothetical protein
MLKRTFNTVEISVPEDWADDSVITMVAPPDGQFRANLLVTRAEFDGVDVAAYARGEIKEIRKAVKKHVVHREEPTEVGGRPAFVLEHSFRSPENVQLRQIQTFVANGRTVYTLALTSEDASFENLRERFGAIARTFRVTG